VFGKFRESHGVLLRLHLKDIEAITRYRLRFVAFDAVLQVAALKPELLRFDVGAAVRALRLHMQG